MENCECYQNISVHQSMLTTQMQTFRDTKALEMSKATILSTTSSSNQSDERPHQIKDLIQLMACLPSHVCIHRTTTRVCVTMDTQVEGQHQERSSPSEGPRNAFDGEAAPMMDQEQILEEANK